MRNKPDLDTIAFMLYLETWLDSEESITELDDLLLKNLHIKWVVDWLPSQFLPHNGDCTKVCAPCTRCAVDELYKQAARIVKNTNE